MNDVREAYNRWSAKYDSKINLTRDLDRIITKKTLIDLRFRSIVEIGCGTGKNTSFLSEISSKVHAVDFSEAMIKQAKQKLNSENVMFSVSDIKERWMFDDRSADLITCNLVLEHIENISFIFSEASRILVKGGILFISELHPFKQYLGAKANFSIDGETVEIDSFIHHISDFFNAAKVYGLAIEDFQEWWHEQDTNKPPRLVTFKFRKKI